MVLIGAKLQWFQETPNCKSEYYVVSLFNIFCSEFFLVATATLVLDGKLSSDVMLVLSLGEGLRPLTKADRALTSMDLKSDGIEILSLSTISLTNFWCITRAGPNFAVALISCANI